MNSHIVKCPQCGKEHDITEMEVSFTMPDEYFCLSEEDRSNRGKITKNFCQLDDRYFVRSLIPIPVLDRDDMYCWGVWIEVEKDDFFTIYNTWEDEDLSDIPKLNGTLANDLPEYEISIGLKGDLKLRNDTRPFFTVSDLSKLKTDQLNGITTEDVTRYYHYIA